MNNATLAEWTKLRTLSRTGWLLLAIIAVSVAAGAAITATTHVSPGASGTPDTTKLALIGVDLGQAVVVILAVLPVADEYATGMIAVTLSAVPRRELVIGAKAINVTCLTLVAAVPAVIGCLLAGRALLPTSELGTAHGRLLLTLTSGATLRAAAGSVLYLALIGLLSLGIATLLRDTAVSTGVVLALLYLPPLFALLVAGPLRRHIEQLAPMSAGLAIQATRNLQSLPVGPWTGLAILAGWAAAALLAGTVALKLLDA